MDQIQNWHGSDSKLAHWIRFLAWAKKQDFRILIIFNCLTVRNFSSKIYGEIKKTLLGNFQKPEMTTSFRH
jgi:hypothetical protein